MLVLLPPSEAKNQGARGRRLDLDRLSFPALREPRRQVLEALVSTSARPDATDRLGTAPGVAAEVARNTALAGAATTRADRLYTGVLYDALDLASLDAASRRRAARWIVIASALFGVVRLADPVAAYRLPICGRLDGMGGLEAHWRAVLDPVLTEAAGRGVIVDCRSGSYLPMWRPGGKAAERWVQIRVPGASHGAKHTRGLVARYLCQHGRDTRSVPALADQLAAGFRTALHEPQRRGAAWVLDVHPPA